MHKSPKTPCILETNRKLWYSGQLLITSNKINSNKRAKYNISRLRGSWELNHRRTGVSCYKLTIQESQVRQKVWLVLERTSRIRMINRRIKQDKVIPRHPRLTRYCRPQHRTPLTTIHTTPMKRVNSTTMWSKPIYWLDNNLRSLYL